MVGDIGVVGVVVRGGVAVGVVGGGIVVGDIGVRDIEGRLHKMWGELRGYHYEIFDDYFGGMGKMEGNMMIVLKGGF